jgi:hypothetical protein
VIRLELPKRIGERRREPEISEQGGNLGEQLLMKREDRFDHRERSLISI